MFKFDSRKKYPPIVRYGDVPFTKGSSSLDILVTNLNEKELFLVAIEESGWLRLPTFYDSVYNGTNHIYITKTKELRLNMGDSSSRTGILHWRIYNNA